MRIIIPAPEKPDCFAHNVAFTLRHMGHEVLTPPAPPIRRLERIRGIVHELRARGSQEYVSPEEKWLLDATKRYRPAMVLALTQILAESTLVQLKKDGVRYRIAWWGDPPANMVRWGLLSPEWDAVYAKDRVLVEKLCRVGCNAQLLHEAMNPAWHRPVASQDSEAIVVAGNWYGFRQALVARLLEAGERVDMYGPPLPRWGMPALRRLHTGRYITMNAKSRVFGAAMACLNNLSFAEGDSLNCRAFEIAGAGGLHIMEYRPAISECFEIDKELKVFRTFDELLTVLEWCRTSPLEVAAMRRAASARALADHTYEIRLRAILRDVGEN